MGDIEYDAAEAARYSELHPDARYVLAEDYDALTAERDEIRRRLDAVVRHIETAEVIDLECCLRIVAGQEVK